MNTIHVKVNDGALDADGAPKLHDASGVKKQNVARKSMGNRYVHH